jgi:hypothetical protein
MIINNLSADIDDISAAADEFFKKFFHKVLIYPLEESMFKKSAKSEMVTDRLGNFYKKPLLNRASYEFSLHLNLFAFASKPNKKKTKKKIVYLRSHSMKIGTTALII